MQPQQGPLQARAVRTTDMDSVAVNGFFAAQSDIDAARLNGCLYAAQIGTNIEQTEACCTAWCALDAIGIAYFVAQNLITTTQADQPAAAA